MTTTTEGKKRRIRCGWCLDGKHSSCAVTIWHDTNSTLFHCACECAVDRTRCTVCGRRDVEVTEYQSRCVDAEGCEMFVAARRAADPRMRMIDEIYSATSPASPAEKGHEKPRKVSPRASGSVCRCCGDPTKGGAFLPGHDARYVSAQAAAFQAATDTEGRAAIIAAMEKCSNALYAKWVKRVGQLGGVPVAGETLETAQKAVERGKQIFTAAGKAAIETNTKEKK